AAADRNGEPEGELGLVLQKDAAWHDQTGGPADPQAGNLPGGKKDVLRGAAANKRDVLVGMNFAEANAAAFFPDVGAWNAVNDRYQANPASGRDAVSLLYTGEDLPDYLEIMAVINANNAKSGFRSNAYIIFDYQGAKDFKFAGVDLAQGKLRIGQR